LAYIGGPNGKVTSVSSLECPRFENLLYEGPSPKKEFWTLNAPQIILK
jgi:hypothetical protein